jgi:plastocyanin
VLRAQLTFATVAALIAAVAVPAFAAPSQTAKEKLTGRVGPGFTISLKHEGETVKKLDPGTYTLTVQDKASIHDFHLMGPGVNKVVTTVPFTGTKTVTVTLKKGKYTYQCDPHSTAMRGTFTVK